MTQQLTPVGCDVSKLEITACIMLDGETTIDLKIVNDNKGFVKLIDQFEQLGIKPHICMEATGNYYEDFADCLTDAGYRVSVINPLKIKNFAKTEFLRTKTDKQDARLIARYCEKMRPQSIYVKPSPIQYQIRRNIAGLRQLNQDLNAVKNRLKVTKDSFLHDILVKHLAMIEHSIKAVKQHIIELTAQSDSAETAVNLQSMPSVGALTAATLTHFLTLYRFASESQFVAFAGLSPQKEQSGTSVNKPDRLSKYGNRTLKASLYMSAVVCMRFGYFDKFIGRLKQRGKPNKVILVALMRKLAGIAWHLWHKGQAFDRCRYGMGEAGA